LPEIFNAADYLVMRHVLEGDGARPAVMAPGQTLLYDDLAAEVRRVGDGLRAVGVRPEERVMFCMADGVELLSGILAAMYIGAVAVPVSTMTTGAELGAILADSRARVLCVSEQYSDPERIVAALIAAPEVTQVFLAGALATADVLDLAVADRVSVRLPGWVPERAPDRVRVRTWMKLIAAGERDAPQLGVPGAAPAGVPASAGPPRPAWLPYPTWPDSPALWLYTSGTTGTPKAAMHRHGSIRAVADCYGEGVLGVRPDDRCLSVAKLFFAYGLGNSAFFPLAAGASVILEPAPPVPPLIAQLAAREQPTLFFAVPTFYAALLASDVPDDSFASVRQAVSAGEALPAGLFERFRERFGVEILDGLGSTEALHIFVSNRPGHVHPGSSGSAVPGYDVALRDASGAPVTAPGVPGELFVRGASIATGYWCRTETTRQVFLGEWLRTGDTYVQNEDGTLTCLGRLGDMLKAGGMWVAPAEVEARLLVHPDVAEVAVVAAYDDAGLEKPVACVVPKPGRHVDPAALIAFCRQGLAAFKRPRAVVEFAELPKTATGKVRRNVLRDQVNDVLRTHAVPPAASTRAASPGSPPTVPVAHRSS
jgi:benzoate-CoA ligase